jgi:large subunit ribosomal protein L9
MNVKLLQDVESLGLAGQIVKVNEGYARNYLFPRKVARIASANDTVEFTKHVQKAKVETALAGSRIALLAEQLEHLKLSIKEKAHENKLYGAINAEQIVELLKAKGVTINKKQVEFPKAIRTTGEHTVIIKLSSKLKPEITVKVSAE